MLKPFFRMSALVAKELLEVIRQPVMVLTLVLGPFLILLIFGLGHRNARPPLDAVLVIPSTIQMPRDLAFWRDRFGPAIRVVGVSDDEAATVTALRERTIDLAVVIPSDPSADFVQGRPATIRVLHNRIDPVDETYVNYLGYIIAAELNKQMIADVARQIQQNVQRLRQPIADLRRDVALARNALQSGDIARARQQIATARAAITTLQGNLKMTEQFAVGISAAMGGDSNVAAQLAALRQTEDQLNALATDLAALDQELATTPEIARSRLATIDSELATFQSLTTNLVAIPPEVLAAPFTSQIESVLTIQPGFVAFYSPSVLALLLQHLAVTVTALSLVGERLLGTLELYQVAPTSTFGLLVGKYVSYTLISLLVSGALTLLMTRLLGVPLRGDIVLFAITLGLLIFASLGIGLTISSLSTSQENAVQFAMLVLLASVFFSGFFLPLDTLQPPASLVSDALPVTYAIVALQDLMLRGELPSIAPLISLGIIGIIFAVTSALLLNRQLRQS